MIPMVDLRGQYQELKDEIDRGLMEALDATKFILGPNVHAFENEAADYLEAKYAVGCASGTDALQLALLAAGVTAGDEVITTPFTFIATAEAILHIGATPIFVDIDARTMNIDTNLIEAAITTRTKAILPVHIFGQPADMTTILELAEQHGLLVIEDCAQSFGARLAERQTGSMGIAGCFSFFPSKNLGCCGDGGLITTSDEGIANHLRVLRNHGSWQRYHHSELGFNSRLDELQAVILRAKLKRIEQYNTGRQRVARRYSAAFAKIDGVTPPYEDGKGTHVYHQYTILSESRDLLMDALQAQQIASAIYYPLPLHQQEIFAGRYSNLSLPVSERIAALCLSLPIYPELENGQVDLVIEAIHTAL